MKITKLCHSLLLGLGFCCVISAMPLRAQVHPYSGMVAFGDSLSDGGNLINVLSDLGEELANSLTGWDPYYYYEYRFSNGPIWVDHLYTSLGFGLFGTMGANDGVNNINGTNFAWAGSRSGNGTYGGIFPNLQLQVDYYSNQLADNNPFLPVPGTTLFAVWSGANDVFAHVESSDPVTPEQVAANIATAISKLYDEGGRYFLVPNLPPIGLIPSYIDDDAKGPLATAFVNLSNAFLAMELDTLSGSLEGINIFKLDTHSLFLELTTNYEMYGFTNVTQQAYTRFDEPTPDPEPMQSPYGTVAPNAGTYFYWDAAHGTTLTNSYIADAAYAAVIPEPTTWVLLLLAGFGALAWRARHSTINQ